jgi:membrane protease YdiL (CAAX protease family)
MPLLPLLGRFVRRRPVTVFLLWFFTVGQVIAFVPVLAAAHGAEVATEPFTIASTLVGLLLPAALVSWVVDGPRAVRGLLRSATDRHVRLRWYLFVVVVVPLVSLAAADAVEGPPEDMTFEGLGAAFTLGLVLQAVAHLVTNNLWEEVAWTGFVQARLQARHSPITAAAVTAPLFALQHTGLVVGGSLSGTVAVLLVLIVLAVPYRAVMGWLYNRTHSLLVVGAAHAAGDAVAAGTALGEGFLPRLFGHSVGPMHLFAFAVLGVVVVLATRGRLGESAAPAPNHVSGDPDSQPSHRARSCSSTTRSHPPETLTGKDRP